MSSIIPNTMTNSSEKEMLLVVFFPIYLAGMCICVYGRGKERERRGWKGERERQTDTGCCQVHVEVRGQLAAVSAFHPSAVSRDRTPDVRFGRGYLCLLSHLTGPEKESTFNSALSCLDGHVIVS